MVAIAQPELERKTIRELRLERGLSQFRLAVAAGVTALAVARWEQGVTTPSELSRHKVARALNVPLEQIDLPPVDKGGRPKKART